MAGPTEVIAQEGTDGAARAIGEAVVSRATAGEVADVFRVLSDPTRVSIVHALTLGELCNSELAAALGISESAVSHQMRELRLMKLVSADRRGRQIYYRLTDSHIQHIFQDTLRHVLEDESGEGRPG